MNQSQLKPKISQSSLSSYIAGFILSLVLTLLAYALAADYANSDYKLGSQQFLVGAVVGLALVQLLVQLVFFLHLGRESKPKWNLMVLAFAAMVVVVLISGSLWIMYSLDYRHPTSSPAQTSNNIIQDEGISR